MVRIVMVLAYGPGRPEGDTADRIGFEACLTRGERFDAGAHGNALRPWRSWHMRPGQPTTRGEVTRLDDGWALESAGDGGLLSLQAAAIRPGEVVRLGWPGGEVLLYRIISVAPC